MIYKDCKYRLPCAWCDKYNRECYVIKNEVLKLQCECEHNWERIGQNTGGTQYRCNRCGKGKTVPFRPMEYYDIR